MFFCDYPWGGQVQGQAEGLRKQWAWHLVFAVGVILGMGIRWLSWGIYGDDYGIVNHGPSYTSYKYLDMSPHRNNMFFIPQK